MTARPSLSALDHWLAREVRRSRAPGLFLGLSRRGKPLLERGLGHRDVERRQPVSSRTVFGIASVSKSFLAAALLRLQEQRRLRLSDHVVQHLPEFRLPDRTAGARIRLHHFLSHSSGLPPLPSLYGDLARWMLADPTVDAPAYRRAGIDLAHLTLPTFESLLEYLAETPLRLLGPPGSVFSYSNEGFALLGLVVERASGRRFEQYLQEEILDPAGLPSTTYDPGVMLRSPEIATIYSRDPRARRWRLATAVQWDLQSSTRTAGGLFSNAQDLLRYLEIYRTAGRVGRSRILRAESVREMLRPRIVAGPGVHYGYGWFLTTGPDGTRFASHGGSLRGVAAYALVEPGGPLSGVALSNLELVPSGRILLGAVNWARGRPLGASLSPLPRPLREPPDLRPYVGTYGSGEGIWFRVRARRPELRVDFTGIEIPWKGVRLAPAGHDEFVGVGPWKGLYCRFRRGRTGRVDAADMGSRVVRRRSAADRRRAVAGTLVW